MSRDLTFRFGEWEVRYVGSKPSVIVLEVTTNCNLSCLHCFRRGMRDKPVNMDYEVFKELIREVRGWGGVDRITFTGWGEPTVHPLILDMISNAKSVAREIHLSTNGVGLAELIDDLIRLGVDHLYVSIDSPDINTYSRVRIGASLTKVLEGLERLKEVKISRRLVKPMLTLIFTITTLNYGQILDAVRLAREVMANRVVYSNVIPPNKELEGLTCLGRDECVLKASKLLSEVSREAMDGRICVQAPYLSVRSYFLCPFIGYGATYVCSDGCVSPCMYFAHEWTPTLYGISRRVNRVVFGRIDVEGLLGVWRSYEYVRFRYSVRSGQMPSCLDCELVNYCSYTLENLFDCLGNSPSCASCPFAKNLSFCPV